VLRGDKEVVIKALLGSIKRSNSPFKLKLMAAAALMLCISIVWAAPLDGQVLSGVGEMSQSGTTTTIQQSSQNLSLTWKSFNIGAGEAVNFVQPSTSAVAVNRILDINGTQILGQLNANGQVYLINPNGILFGQGAQVNVGALVASTLDLDDADLDGNVRLFNGNGTGGVVNQGHINAADGGYVALLGNTASNQGTIAAQLGAVVLGGGNAITLTFQDNRFVKMQVDQSVLETLAENGGLIRADGGQVIMNAGAERALLTSVVNNSGVIEAHTVDNRAGSIVILGGMHAGTVNVAGTLDASAQGDGNGGFIETSAAYVQIADDVTVTTAASSSGQPGTWLIDPTDFNIGSNNTDSGNSQPPSANMSGSTLSTALSNGNVSIMSSNGTAQGEGNINVNEPVSWGSHTLTLTAANHININAVMTASGTFALVMNTATTNGNDSGISGGGILVGMNATGFTGRVDFGQRAGSGILAINGASYKVINSLGTPNSTSTDLQGISGANNYALGNSIDATATSTWHSGAGFAPISGFTGNFNGLGHTVSNLVIDRPTTNHVGLFGSTTAELSNLGLKNARVTGANYVGALVGYTHLAAGKNLSNNYSQGGRVHGTGTHAGGLVGWITLDAGNFSNNFATGHVEGAGGTHHGGLVGWSTITTGDFTNNYATGNVLGGSTHQGGLAGWSTITTGNFTNNYASGSVNGSTHTGGLAGWSTITTGNFTNNYASGSVNGSTHTGGLAGWSTITTGSLNNNYASGNVAGTTYTGGLAGWSTVTTGDLRNNYATGQVTGTTPIGGLLGFGAGAAAHSSNYWNTETSGLMSSAGGTGKTTTEMQSKSTFADWDFSDTWFMQTGSTYPLLKKFMATLNVTASDVTQTYDATGFDGGNGVTYSLIESSPIGTLMYGGSSQGAVNAGTYAITPAGLTPTQHHMITYTSGTLTITKAPLTVSANNQSRVYGSDNPVFSATVSGFVNGETTNTALGLTGAASVSSAATTLTNVGTAPISVAVGTLEASNYSFSDFNAGTLNITEAQIAVQPENQANNAATPIFNTTTGEAAYFQQAKISSAIHSLLATPSVLGNDTLNSTAGEFATSNGTDSQADNTSTNGDEKDEEKET